jgi:hypothetical protein
MSVAPACGFYEATFVSGYEADSACVDTNRLAAFDALNAN